MPRRRRMTRAERQAETRAELLAAAGRVFARRGYDAASVSEIAEEAGYSHGAVYSNFAGKEELFLALYEEWVAQRVAEIEATWSREGTLSERARAAAEDWLEHLDRSSDAFLLRLEFTIRAARDPKLRRKLSARVGAVPLAMRRLIEERAEAEGRTFRLPPEDLAAAQQALSLGLALEALGDRSAVPPGLAGELAAMIIEALTAPTPAGR